MLRISERSDSLLELFNDIHEFYGRKFSLVMYMTTG